MKSSLCLAKEANDLSPLSPSPPLSPRGGEAVRPFVLANANNYALLLALLAAGRVRDNADAAAHLRPVSRSSASRATAFSALPHASPWNFLGALSGDLKRETAIHGSSKNAFRLLLSVGAVLFYGHRRTPAASLRLCLSCSSSQCPAPVACRGCAA